VRPNSVDAEANHLKYLSLQTQIIIKREFKVRLRRQPHQKRFKLKKDNLQDPETTK